MIAPFINSNDTYLNRLPKDLDNRIIILVELNKLREKDPTENKENLLHSLIENSGYYENEQIIILAKALCQLEISLYDQDKNGLTPIEKIEKNIKTNMRIINRAQYCPSGMSLDFENDLIDHTSKEIKKLMSILENLLPEKTFLEISRSIEQTPLYKPFSSWPTT